MDIYRKICIAFIIIIFTYILTRLFQRRFYIEQNSDNVLEGYSSLTVNSIQNANSCTITIKDDLAARLLNITTLSTVDVSAGLYLKNYAIKASMNSAYDGKICTTDMINYVMTRGCRLIDFEIFREPESTTTIVSVSTSTDYTAPIHQEHPLTISDAMNYVSQIGFNSTCPNSHDPLFIQLRPRIPVTEDPDIHKSYAMKIYNDIYNSFTYLSDNLYTGILGIPPEIEMLFSTRGIDISETTHKVTPTTFIPLLLGKIILIMDTTLYPDYVTYCPNLANTINMDNKIGELTTTFSYGSLPAEYPLTLSTDKYSCTTTKISQVLWMDSKNVSYNTNADSYPLYKNYSCQLVPMLFFNNGSDLYNYEMLFNNCGGGIVPLSLIYGKVTTTTTPHISYPQPIFAMPNYGNATASIIIITACIGVAGFILVKEE